MIVYRVTNIITKDFYIGITKYNLEYRKKGHYQLSIKGRSHFSNAIRKYGPDIFKWEVIHKNVNCYEKLKRLEKNYIAILKPQYNMTAGGDGTLGRVPSSETRAKMSLANKGNKKFLGKKHSQETKDKISLKNKGKQTSLGKKLSQETKSKISLAMKGKKQSQEHTNKISLRNNGKKRSQETKDKISLGNKGKQNFLGKKHSQETKNKISLARKRKKIIKNDLIGGV